MVVYKRTRLQIMLVIFVSAVWWLSKPTEIIAAHGKSILLVKHFPYFKSQKIAWWEANKDMLKEKYGLPVTDEEGFYTVYILDYGDGYRVNRGTDEDADLLCFDDMKSKANCIEKEPLFRISHSRNIPLSYE